LARGIELLQTVDPSIPAVYGLRTRLIDEDGNEIGFSPLFRKLPGFRCALVQSIAGGNTMISNQTARELLVFCGPDVNVPSHDWWLYQVTCTFGGFMMPITPCAIGSTGETWSARTWAGWRACSGFACCDKGSFEIGLSLTLRRSRAFGRA
jgi:hypothetical protein